MVSQGVSLTTVMKSSAQQTTIEATRGPKQLRSIALKTGEAIVAFLGHTLRPLDDCLYGLHSKI